MYYQGRAARKYVYTDTYAKYMYMCTCMQFFYCFQYSNHLCTCTMQIA